MKSHNNKQLFLPNINAPTSSMLSMSTFMVSTSRLSLKLHFSFDDANPEWSSSMM